MEGTNIGDLELYVKKRFMLEVVITNRNQDIVLKDAGAFLLQN